MAIFMKFGTGLVLHILYSYHNILIINNIVAFYDILHRQMTELSETVIIHHNPLVQRVLQHAFFNALTDGF